MNQFILKGQDVSIHFNDINSPLIEKSLSYQDSHQQVLARGDEISDRDTSRGREVTVTLEQNADGSEQLFTLLIPRLRIGAGDQAVGFRTVGLLTRRGASSRPQTGGQSDTYECVSLSGKMVMVPEGAQLRQQEGGTAQEFPEARSFQGITPERFELKGEGVELNLDMNLSTGAPKALHYRDSSSEVDAGAEEIRWSRDEYGVLVTIKLDQFRRRTVDPGTIFFSLLVPRTSGAAVQPISTKGFRTVSRMPPRSEAKGQLQTYEVVNLEGRAIIFVQRAAEESARSSAPV